MIRIAKFLLQSNSGATALEFALLAPLIIFTVVLGIIQAHALLLQTWLSDAVIEASRYGSTGQTTSGVNDTAHRLADIQNVVISSGGGHFSSINTLGLPTTQISITPYASFAGVPASLSSTCPAPGQPSASADPGSGRQIVVYCLVYANDSFVNQVFGIFMGLGFNMHLVSTALVVNEPF